MRIVVPSKSVPTFLEKTSIKLQEKQRKKSTSWICKECIESEVKLVSKDTNFETRIIRAIKNSTYSKLKSNVR